MIPSNLTAREVLCLVDAVIGHPTCYTAARCKVSTKAILRSRATLARKLGMPRVNVAMLIRAAYALTRDP